MSKRIACGLKALKELLLPPYKVECGIKGGSLQRAGRAVLVAAVLFCFWNIADSQCCRSWCAAKSAQLCILVPLSLRVFFHTGYHRTGRVPSRADRSRLEKTRTEGLSKRGSGLVTCPGAHGAEDRDSSLEVCLRASRGPGVL